MEAPEGGFADRVGLWRPVLAYVDIVDRISDRLGAFSMYVSILLVAIGFLNVILRYVGQWLGIRLTSNMVIELQWYLFAVIFLFAFGYNLRHNINVRVDFWFANQSQRRKAWIDFVGHIIALLPFCVLALWVSWDPILRSWGLGPDGIIDLGRWEVSPDPSGLPRAPIKSLIIVGFGLLLLQGIAEMAKLTAILTGHEEYAEIEEHDAPLRIE
jgi:TRAP-type mannitol/chloroaromatic compound transport system permease small subunit